MVLGYRINVYMLINNENLPTMARMHAKLYTLAIP